MSLTGRSSGPPLGAPGALVDLVARAASVLRRRSGGRVTSAGLALLGERAAVGRLGRPLERQGDRSCGGSTRLLAAADGWVAVSLARMDDTAALPAWLGVEVPTDDPWPTVETAVAGLSATLLDERAALLGLPVARLASVAPPSPVGFDLPIVAGRLGDAPPLALAGASVVDLSSLWAGPLCGQLLAEAGATVVKVESVARPDGARGGPSPFFDLLNGAKRSVALDLGSPEGLTRLRGLLEAADVVMESARPRGLEQLGLVAAELLQHAPGPRVWASITSHGRHPEGRGRVGFGDVAAVAGGLVTWDGAGPCFVADAVTDPVTGLVAAAAVAEALATGGRWMIDAAMAPLAASVAGEPLDVRGLEARAPRARPVARRAPTMGRDTTGVLAAIGS
jgi:CoA-transferase family III